MAKMSAGEIYITATFGLAAGGLVLAAGILAGKKKKKRRRKPNIRKISFEKDGETFTTMRKGDLIQVSYDPLSPLQYVGVPTDTVQLAVGSPAGIVGFVVKKTMASGNVDQVYVQAVAEDGTIMGEHKITVQGP